MARSTETPLNADSRRVLVHAMDFSTPGMGVVVPYGMLKELRERQLVFNVVQFGGGRARFSLTDEGLALARELAAREAD